MEEYDPYWHRLQKSRYHRKNIARAFFRTQHTLLYGIGANNSVPPTHGDTYAYLQEIIDIAVSSSTRVVNEE